LFNNQESFGTKAYTFKEVRQWLDDLPVKILNHKATVNNHDLLYYKSRPFRFIAYICASLFGWNKVGWFMTIELKKVG